MSGSFGWAVGIESSGHTSARAVAADAAGNTYVTGRFSGSGDFDPGGGNSILISAGQGDVFVAKFAPSGALIWARSFGGTGDETGAGLAVDTSGNVYTTGTFYGTADFDPGPGIAILTTDGGTDVFVCKLDSAGNFVWVRGFGGSGNDEPFGLAADASGSVYATGTFTGSADFNPGPGTSLLTSAGLTDVFVSKLSPSGSLSWARGIGGTGSDHVFAIALDSTGNVHLAGSFSGTVDFDPGPGITTRTTAGGADAFVCKWDPNGNFGWVAAPGGTGDDGALGVAVDARGQVYASGYYTATADFDPGPGTAPRTSAGGYDAFVSQFDSAGLFQRAYALGGTEYDAGNAIAADAAGNVYVAGQFQGAVDFDPGPGSAVRSAAGSYDVFQVKLTATGTLGWADIRGGIDYDDVFGIALDASGNQALAGTFTGPADFDPGSGTAVLTANSSDLFLARKPNTPPAITSNGGGAAAPISLPEGTILVTTVTASDADPGTVLTYAIAGGADAARFAIDPLTGRLTFLQPPDYETPADAGRDNVYDVVVRTSDGSLADSQALAVSIQVPPAPASPTGFSAAPGDSQVLLSWTPVPTATQYRVFRSLSSGGAGNVVYQTVSTAGFVDTAVTNGTTYYYQVAAVNGGGQGPKTTEASVTPQLQPPPAPGGFVAVPGNEMVRLTWAATPGAVSYSIFRGNSPGVAVLYRTGISATTFADTTLVNGTTYYYQVSAVNPGGESPRSPERAAMPRHAPSLVGYPEFAIGNGVGGVVRFFHSNGAEQFAITPFPGFTGGIRVAAADFTGDGVADLVAGTGPGGPTRVRVLDGTDQHELFAIEPFEPAFTGGVYVAAGDATGDGIAELVISPDEGGGPRVRVFNGNGFAQIADYFGIEDPDFRGGVRTAVNDLNGDGKADLLVAAGFGGGPRLALFDGSQLGPNGGPKLTGDFFVFEQTLRNGVFIAAGDIDGDGYADVIAGGGPGGGPRVYALSGASLLTTGAKNPVANFFTGNIDDRGGVRVAVKDLDGDGNADLLTGAGADAGSHVTAYLGRTVPADGPPDLLFQFDAFSGFTDGVFVG